MDIIKLIEELEDLLEESSSVPFSSKVMVDREEAFDIIQQIRIILPDEVQQAKWIKDEKERIIGEAEKEAINIEENTSKKVEELLNEHRITQMAEEKAEEMLERAKYDAKEIRLGALEYADKLLLESQNKMSEIIDLISKNREELQE